MGFAPFHLRRWMRHARRYRHIVAVLIKYGFGEIADRLPRRLRIRIGSRARQEGETRAMKLRRPQRVRLMLRELGPTFIKFGQLLSTRPDMISAEYVLELSKLQDRVEPGPFEPIRQLVEEDLGGTLEEKFREFDPEPIAAASIAQVHRAVLRDGRVAAMKVCRPGLRRKLVTECEMIENIADWLGTIHHDSGTIHLPRMVREFTGAVVREADMSIERRNIQRFARNFAHDPTVHVPDVYEDYCSENILAMEYIDGLKPTSVEDLTEAGFDPETIAQRGANFVLRQIFDFGLFHSDPHPGNMLLVGENLVVPLDFGQVARLRQCDRELLSDIVLAIVSRDHEEIIRACRNADLLDDDTDIESLTADSENLISRYYDMPLKDIPLREVITSIFQLIRRHQVHPPPQFTLMLKSLMTIESLANRLDPNFDIIAALQPYARKFRLEQLNPLHRLRHAHRTVRDAMDLAASLPDDARQIIGKIKKGDFQLRVHHEHLVEVSSTLDKASHRVSFALIIAALLVASSMLTPQEGRVLGVVSLQVLGVVGYCFAAVLGIWLLISILRSRRM